MENKFTLSLFLAIIFLQAGAQDFTKYVNPFIGTTNEGNTVPGATMPFGMVQLSPDTRITTPSGYDYKDSVILGFSYTHLSGTGIGDLGDILTMPVNLSAKDLSEKFLDFSSSFSHANEKASPGFYRGNAFQYSFYVPQQVDTLIQLFGGRKRFEKMIDSLFTIKNKEGNTGGAITGLIGQYAHGNEPSHHIAYLYNFIGKQNKTAGRVHNILQTQYSNKPDGLCGNDDCGQMSAWYVYSVLGFYPVNPADGKYYLVQHRLPKPP